MRHNRAIQLVPDNLDTLDPADARFVVEATIDDLREWERLGGEGAACLRHGLVDKYDVKKRFGINKLVELQPLLHCMGCDTKRATSSS